MDRYSNNQSAHYSAAESTSSRVRTVQLSHPGLRRRAKETSQQAASSAPADRASRPAAETGRNVALADADAFARRGKGPSRNRRVAPAPAGKDGAVPSGRSTSRAARTNFMKYAADNRAVHAVYEFTTGRTKPLAIALVILAILGGLYGPVRDYYVAYRTGDILARQLQVSEQYNESLQSDVSKLLSKEGIEDEARSKLGLVMPGEKTLEVKGLDDDSSSDSSDSSSSLTASEIAKREAEVAAEAPWYIKVLDTVFFYSCTGSQEVSSSGNSTSGE